MIAKKEMNQGSMAPVAPPGLSANWPALARMYIATAVTVPSSGLIRYHAIGRDSPARKVRVMWIVLPKAPIAIASKNTRTEWGVEANQAKPMTSRPAMSSFRLLVCTSIRLACL